MSRTNEPDDRASLLWEIRTLRANLETSEQARADVAVALRRSEERFRLFVRSIRDYAIFILDPTGHILSWNEGAQRLKGYTEQEILGKSFATFYTPEDLAKHVPERLLLQATQEGRVENEGWRVRKDGSRFWAEVVITAVRDETGQLIGFAKVTRDLTEQRHTIEARIQFAEERMARKAAEEAVRQRDEFLGIAAHELKTPMTTLLLQIQLLVRRLNRGDALDPTSFRRALGVVEDQSRKLSELVTRLLDVSRVTDGRLIVDRSETDLVPLVRSVVDRLQTLVPLRTFVVCVPDSAIAPLDSLRIEQVLTNLLNNAVAYSEEGPIEVTITKPYPDQVQLIVRDHGPGVPEPKRASLFNRFYQADIHNYRAGMGLGLYISKQIAQLHGGDLTVDFPSDGGSRFVVSLPLRPKDET